MKKIPLKKRIALWWIAHWLDVKIVTLEEIIEVFRPDCHLHKNPVAKPRQPGALP